MRTVTFAAIIQLLSMHALWAFLPFSEGGKVEWEQKMRGGFESLDQKSDDEKIEYLSGVVMALSGTYLSLQTADVRREATRLLLSTPGHAIYYRDKIEAMRSEALATSKKSDQEIFEMANAGREVVYEVNYMRYAEMIAFPTLGMLPSAETVGVLGHFLADPEGRDGKSLTGRPLALPSDDFLPPKPNAEWAVLEIRKLGIDRPPVPVAESDGSGLISEGEVDAWLGWWNEIAAGRRTYRFAGSEVEYGPDGPATAEAVRRNALNRRRDAERKVSGRVRVDLAVGDDMKEGPVEGRRPWAGILVGGIIFAAAVWVLAKRRGAG